MNYLLQWSKLRNLPSKLDFEGDYNFIKKTVHKLERSNEEKTPLNPSRKATLRVADPLAVPHKCNICGEEAVRLGRHEEIYFGRTYGEWPYIYICDCCGSYVGIHNFTNIPLGTLADAKTREARKRCKPPFERLWKSGKMTRDEAYAYLAKQMGIPRSECHFGMFTASQCMQAKQILESTWVCQR